MILSDVLVTRTLLALGDLNLNDALNYRLGFITPGTQPWRRQQAMSAFVDGAFTTHRSRDVRQMKLSIDVNGADQTAVAANMAVLTAAFDQDYFEISWKLDGQETRFAGEAADRTNNYDQARVHARRFNVEFDFPAQPIPLVGAL